MKFYYVKRLRIVTLLREKGIFPLETLPDLRNPRFNVWKYEATPELMEIVETFYKSLEE